MTDREYIVAVFEHAGIEPSEVDLEHLVNAFPMVKQLVGALYSVDVARYEEPALVFLAAPRFIS